MPEAPTMFVLGSFVVACSAKVSAFPSPGESLAAEAFTFEAGGKGLNLAVGACRLGAGVDGLLAVGDDPFSHLAAAVLAETGLPRRMLRRFPGPSGAGIGFTDIHGENCLAVYSGANALLSADDVLAVGRRLRRAHLVLAQFEIGDAPIATAFAVARANGAATILNPSPFRHIDGRILRNTTIVIVNRTEATRLGEDLGIADAGPGQLPDLDALARALFDYGVETLVVTLGENGAVACDRNVGQILQPRCSVVAVDTLGAGDAFTAAFAAALLAHLPLPECLRHGAAAGALATTRLGVLAALPTSAQLAACLSTMPPPMP